MKDIKTIFLDEILADLLDIKPGIYGLYTKPVFNDMSVYNIKNYSIWLIDLKNYDHLMTPYTEMLHQPGIPLTSQLTDSAYLQIKRSLENGGSIGRTFVENILSGKYPIVHVCYDKTAVRNRDWGAGVAMLLDDLKLIDFPKLCFDISNLHHVIFTAGKNI